VAALAAALPVLGSTLATLHLAVSTGTHAARVDRCRIVHIVVQSSCMLYLMMGSVQCVHSACSLSSLWQTAFFRTPCLPTLLLQGHSLGVRACEALAAALPLVPALTSLDLGRGGGQGLSDNHLLILAPGLQVTEAAVVH
jgi:hypothetical protein